MKLSEKKKSVAGKMNPYPSGHLGSKMKVLPQFELKKKGRASLTPVKHKVDVAGQESYKEEDK